MINIKCVIIALTCIIVTKYYAEAESENKLSSAEILGAIMRKGRDGKKKEVKVLTEARDTTDSNPKENDLTGPYKIKRALGSISSNNQRIRRNSGDMEWYMLDVEITRLPCSALARCYYYIGFLRTVLLEVSKTEPTRIDDTPPGSYKTTTDKIMEIAKKYAKLTQFPNYENFKNDIYPECAEYNIIRCETRLAHLATKSCEETLKFTKKDLICASKKWPASWNMYKFIAAYAEEYKLEAPQAETFIAENYKDEFFWASHSQFLRILKITQKEWKKWSENKNNYVRMKQSYFLRMYFLAHVSPCEIRTHIICKLIPKFQGNIECYDWNMSFLPCLGRKERPEKLHIHLKLGRGRKISSQEIFAPYRQSEEYNPLDLD